MSATLSNVQLGTAVATLDGLVSLDANTIYVNGQPVTGLYLNSNTNTSNVNTQIKLTSSGQFDIQDANALSIFNIGSASRVITGSRFQQSGAPVTGNDLTNKTYVDSLALNAIQKIGTTTGLNGNAVLSTTSGATFSFSDGSGNNLVVYSQNSTSNYTAKGIWSVYTSNSPTVALIQCQESTRITSFYNPQTSWSATDALDIPNKAYVDSAISASTSGFWQKTGSIGLSGLYQLLASSSILFQNSSGTSLLTLSGSGVGINNGLLTGTTNLYTLYNTYGGSNQLLQIDSNGNLQNCPNLSYTYGGASSTILTTIPTAIGGQQQTLQWIRNTSSPQGWYLSSSYISKFPQTNIPITIPLLYSSSLTTTDTTTYNAITMNCNDTTAGTSMRMFFSHGTAGLLNSIIQSAVLSSSKTELRYYTQNSSLLWDWSMSYNGTQAVLETPQSYFYIGNNGNNISTASNGLSISTTAIRPNAPISYPTSTGNISLSAPQIGNSPQAGDRIVLWPGDSSGYAYALGMNGGTMWYNVPSGAIHQFYVGGVSTFYINGSGTTITSTGTGVELLTFYQSATASTSNFINIKFQHGSANNVNSYIQSSLLGTAVTSTLRFYTTTVNVGKEAFQMSVTGTLGILKSAQTYFQINDSATNAIYTNSNGINIDSANGGVFLSNTGIQTTFPQNVVIGTSTSSLQFGQMSTSQFTNTSVAWSGGYTAGNFTKTSASSYVTVTGGVTCYTFNVGSLSVTIRLYNNSSGVYYYYTQNQFFNIVSSHVFIPTNNTLTGLPSGVYTVYIYGGGSGITSDTNDYVNMTFRVSPS